MYLLITGCFSVIVPLFKNLLPNSGYVKEITYYMAPIIVTGKNQINISHINYLQVAGIIYFSGAIILLVKFIIKLFRIFLLVKNNNSTYLDGQKIVLLDKGNAPFSFFRTIFLTNEQISDKSIDSILAHEKTHVQQFHSIDILFFEILKIIQWFNPFAWNFKKEIEAQLEFSADSGLISGGTNINEYKNVLVAYSFGVDGGAITNNFNSLLKRRFEMLSKQRSGSYRKFKFLFSLPLMALLVMSIGVVNGSLSFTSGQIKQDDKSKVFTYVEQMPEFPGGDEALYAFITNNIVYPDDAKRAGVEGKVYVQFVVNKDGSVTDVKVQNRIGAGCDEEAVRVVKLMSKWVPGKHKGEVVKVRLAMPIMFALK
ncbi:MAG: M56 family metallopeptidase [Ignavibacteriaceae bacterium]|nr:M56 family metallopeptidase [Ignavibacteriaceae bacterium]